MSSGEIGQTGLREAGLASGRFGSGFSEIGLRGSPAWGNAPGSSRDNRLSASADEGDTSAARLTSVAMTMATEIADSSSPPRAIRVVMGMDSFLLTKATSEK
jgi:hypothetical protein